MDKRSPAVVHTAIPGAEIRFMSRSLSPVGVCQVRPGGYSYRNDLTGSVLAALMVW